MKTFRFAFMALALMLVGAGPAYAQGADFAGVWQPRYHEDLSLIHI